MDIGELHDEIDEIYGLRDDAQVLIVKAWKLPHL